MSKMHSLKILALGTALMISVSGIHSASAQDASAEHISAAKAAINGLGVTKGFDNILPRAAEQIKSSLIQANPNFSEEISLTVNDEAIKLASRRSDLENEAANIYTKNFTIEELNEIAAFYGSETGQKLLKVSPGIGRELIRAAEIWGSGVSRDLNTATSKVLTEKLNKPAEKTEN